MFSRKVLISLGFMVFYGGAMLFLDIKKEPEVALMLGFIEVGYE